MPWSSAVDVKKYAVLAIAPESVAGPALGKKSMAVGTIAMVGPAAKTIKIRNLLNPCMGRYTYNCT